MSTSTAAASAGDEPASYDLSMLYVDWDNMTDAAAAAHYGGHAGLLEVYYSPRRFAAETACALVAATANLSVLVAMRRAYDIMAVGQNRSSSAYSLLFVNLSIANSLSSILSWLSNNSLFLFNRQLIEVLSTEPCLFFSPVFSRRSRCVVLALGIVVTGI